MNFTVRRCRQEDAPAIYILNRGAMGYDFPREETKHRLVHLLSDPEHMIFVAEADGEVIGYVHACSYDLIYAPPMKNIMGIAVRKEYRGNGIGAALLRMVEEQAFAHGASAVRLVSGETRTLAHEFYRRQGYGEGRRQLNFKKPL